MNTRQTMMTLASVTCGAAVMLGALGVFWALVSRPQWLAVPAILAVALSALAFNKARRSASLGAFYLVAVIFGCGVVGGAVFALSQGQGSGQWWASRIAGVSLFIFLPAVAAILLSPEYKKWEAARKEAEREASRSYVLVSSAQSGGTPLSPAVHDYMMKARSESEALIAVLAKCQSKQELLAGFARAAEIASSRTGNEQLANACRSITSTGSDFSTDQLQVLRDDIIRQARAFISSTESAR